MQTDKLILSALLSREDYARAVLPYLKDEYFQNEGDKVIFNQISNYFTKFNTAPTKEALYIETENKTNLSEESVKRISETIKTLTKIDEHKDWLVETTEAFCKERALFNALAQSVGIVDGKDKNLTRDAIPSILQQALAVCFDNTVGHDFMEDHEKRYEYYNRKENKIPTGIAMVDEVTRGGPSRKTLNVILAPPHGGKSLTMVNFAIGAMKAGFNALYITMEMAEEEIGKRFDINMMNVDFDMMEKMSKDIFTNKFNKIKEKATGKLVIREYPTAGAHPGHFRNLIQELRVKKNFVPDVIVVDYMNICLSQRYKAGSAANSYTIVKSIGEELRALAIETNTVVWTATQTTRSGIGNSDIDMTNTSESIGIPAIADFFVAIIDSEELRSMNQLILKQLKNRYDDKNKREKFSIGIDRSKMKLYDLEESAQKNITQSVDILNKVLPAVQKKTKSNDDSESPFKDDVPMFDRNIKPKAKEGFNFDGFKF